MTEISILDLQNLRHLIGGYSTTHCKMTDYASKASWIRGFDSHHPLRYCSIRSIPYVRYEK